MKLHLPTPLRAALMATFAAILTLGSAAYASTTYDDLTTPDYFDANANVYNTGKGTFYLETPSCDLNLTLTLNLNSLADYQSVHDYANGGYYSPFVTWTYNNNPGATYGMADVARGYSGVDYDSGFTGYWAGKPWTTGTKITTETLWSDFADEDGNITLTINNTPNGTTKNVVVTAVNNSGTTQTLYSVNGLRSQNYTSQHITAFTVNMNYVTSVTLNTASTLDSANFTPPKDYSIPFQSQRTDGTSVGRVMFLGDSITHGVQDMSYRWDMFKTFVDNGIENEIAGPLSGYHSQPLNSDFNGDFSTSQYGGETFVNAHYAQSSGRTHNMLTASGSQNALGNSTGVNYGGVSSSKTGKDYNADTFVMMMGTNDILSDGAYNDTNMPKVTERLLGAGSVQNGVWVNDNQEAALIGALGTDPATSTYVGKWGTMGQIIDNMKMDASDTMYIVSIPTWGEGRTGLNGAASYVAEYNVKLEKWVDAYNASHTGTVKYVDVNKGLVNVTRNGQFLAPDAFFRTTGGDYIHPNEQGALIIAGNLAQGMGIGGRTAGLTRSAVGHEGHNWQSAAATINLSAGQNVQAISNAFTIDGGYTIDFGATFGDGSANGWLANTNALSVFIGDGTNSGTLKISEGYISWGDKLLYCQDNHLTSNDNLRVAYTQGNDAQNIGSGYYVWLGDKLIGQALTAGTGNTTNGVTLTSTGGSSVITGLSYTNTAYAPSTNFITAYDNGLVSSDGPTPPDVPLTPMPSHDNANKVVSGVDWKNAVTSTEQKGVTNASAFSDGKATVELTAVGGWFAAGAVTAKGDIEAKVSGKTTTNNAFAMQAGTLTGNVTMEIDNSTVNAGSYSDLSAALAGSYGGASVTGTFAAYINGSTLNGDMVGGTLNGTGSIGAVNFVVNSGTVNGTIYGGSKTAGSVGDGTADAEGNFSNKAVAITVNGGHITGDINGSGTAGIVKGNAEILITGGVIDGDIKGGTIQGSSKVTVQGNLASIAKNITADTVKLEAVTNSGHTDGFDQYEGTITAANLELNKYTADEVKAQLVGEHLHVTGNSATNVSKLNLTACDITVDDGSSLTLSGLQEYGHTTTYTGNITIAKGTTFSVAEPTEGVYPQDENGNKYTSGANGFKYTGYVYDVLKPTENSTGRLFAEDGQPLGLTTNLTLQGAGELEGAFFVYKADTGVLSAFEKILTDTCYINTGVLVYSKEAGAYGATESLQLNNGANLVMADNLADGVNIRSNGGTLTLLDKVKLDASRLTVNSAQNTILAGSGTFALAAGSKSLGTGLSTDAEEWKGTILMSTTAGQTIANISADELRALAPNADAWVEMNNVTGYFASTDQIFTSNIRLMGDKALHINSGYAKTYTFAGDIAGDGTFTHKYDGNSYTFQGDISEWVGAFETTERSTYNRATGVTLEGKATTLNAALHSNAGSALNLTLGDITNGASAYTFNNEVVVNELNASGKNIVLGAADDALPGGSLEVSGTATMAQLTMQEGTAASFGGELTIDSLNLEGGNSVHLGANATLNAASVHAAAGTSSSLSGAGTIQLQAKALPGLVLADDWTGRVFLHDTTIADGGSYWMNALSKSGSVLELSGFTGYDSSWAYNDNTANICLTDTASGGAAWTFNAPTSYTTYDLSASGNWSGTGTFKADGTNKLKYSFSGDMSEWTGTFDYNVVDSTLTLKENATVLNAAIHRTGGTMALDLSGNTTTTLNNTVEVASLSAAGKNVILGSHGEGETATHGALSVSGDAAIGTLTVNGGCSASFAGTTSITDIKVDDTAQLSFGSGSTVTTNTLGVINNGGSATANVIIDLTNNTVLKIAGANDSVVFAAHGERVNIEAGSALNIVSKGVTVESIDGETSAAFYTPVGHATGDHYTYKQNSYGFTVENAKMTLNNTGATTLNNVLKNTDVVNEGTGKLTIDQTSTKAGEQNTLHGIHAKNGAVTLLDANTSAATLTNIKAEGGDVTLEGLQTAVVANLNDLYIGDERTVSLYQGTTAAGVEGVITVNGTLTAGEGSTLNADLVLGTNAKLDFASEGLHMGSTLTLQSGSTITLGDRLIEYANTLIRSESVTLFTGVDALTIGGGAYDSTQTYSAADYFDLTGFNYGAEHYAVTYDSASGTVSLFMATPEPATSTLSLLALAALAARRKRK